MYKKLIFYFSPPVPYLYGLHDKKIIKIQEIKISHLGTFKCRIYSRIVKIKDLSMCTCLKGLAKVVIYFMDVRCNGAGSVYAQRGVAPQKKDENQNHTCKVVLNFQASFLLYSCTYVVGLRVNSVITEKTRQLAENRKKTLFVGLILSLFSLLPCATLFQRTICTK